MVLFQSEKLVIYLLTISNFYASAFVPPNTQSLAATEIDLKSAQKVQLSATIKNNEVVQSMPMPLPSELRNTFYLLRHGQSTANVANIISSARSLMYSDKHGLTPLGVEQGEKSAVQLKELVTSDSIPMDGMKNKIVFYSSPFARARQTAQACVDTFIKDHMEGLDDWDVTSEVQLEDGLIER